MGRAQQAQNDGACAESKGRGRQPFGAGGIDDSGGGSAAGGGDAEGGGADSGGGEGSLSEGRPGRTGGMAGGRSTAGDGSDRMLAGAISSLTNKWFWTSTSSMSV